MSPDGRPVRVAINGLGRIGRAFLKLAIARPELQVVAVNDLGDPANLAYLLRYDTVYGRSSFTVSADDHLLAIDSQEVRLIQEKDPTRLPWRDLQIDVVVEATGIFETYAKARAHLEAGAHKVVITAPAKDEPPPGVNGATVLMGLNDERLAAAQITSNASCTTNSASPVIHILHESLGIEKAILNTVHAYTATQKIVDSPDAKDFRRGRAAAANIVPSTTGAAIAVTKALPALEGRFDGIAIRVPVACGSIADITFLAKRRTTVDEVNTILRQAAGAPRWQGIFAVTEEPLVSSDIIGSPYASIADLGMTTVVADDLVKVLAWYDNETGYAHTLVEHVLKTARAGV